MAKAKIKRKPKPARQARLNWMISRLDAGVPPWNLFQEATSKYKLTAATIRQDIRWIANEVAKRFEDAWESEAVRLYVKLDNIAAMSEAAGAAMPLRDARGELVMGIDGETGQLFPLVEANAQLLKAAVSARQAQVGILGWQSTKQWQAQLRARERKLMDAKIRVAQVEAGAAEREAEVQAERQRLRVEQMKRGGGGGAGAVGRLQGVDDKVMADLARCALIGKLQVSGHMTLEARGVRPSEEKHAGTGDGSDEGGDG